MKNISKVNLLSASSIIVFIFSVIFSLELGPSNIKFLEILAKLIQNHPPTGIEVIYNIRLPQILSVIISGGSLAVTGLVLQRILRNPLVEPGITGVSGGSALGIIVVSNLITATNIYASVYKTTTSFIFGLIVGAILLYISIRYRETLLVIVAGVIINSFVSGLILLLQTLLNPYKINSVMIWMLGSVGIVDYSILSLTLLITFISFSLIIYFSRFLDIISLGDIDAHSLGVDINFWRSFFLGIAILQTSISVSLTGIIAFVGFVIPNMINIIMKDRIISTKRAIILSFLLGASFTLISFTLSKVIARPFEMPIGVVTGLLGAPIFFIIILKNIRIHSA